VTFDDESATFEDAGESEQPTIPPTTVAATNEWRVDGFGPLHPSTEHKESRITWRSAPSCIAIGGKQGRYRESYDLDLLAFQAGSNASDEEESTYLENDIDGHITKGVPLEQSEDDSIPEDKPGQAHSTPTIDAEDLANEPERINPAPQPTIERLKSVIIVVNAPEIDFEFGEEPTIEITSFY